MPKLELDDFYAIDINVKTARFILDFLMEETDLDTFTSELDKAQENVSSGTSKVEYVIIRIKA